MDKLIVALSGITVAVFTFWLFLMKKASEVAVENEVDIIVEGGYSPEVISIPKGRPTKINFIRKDRSACLEEIVLPDFKIKKFLPVGEKVTLQIKPAREGEFGFACGMNMFHGKIIVR